ncbi:protein FAR1-RELATED SEQUENCE 5-like [Senna tora]|uniref:Protein FAR1-RELATED SEQUENCE 5-like n=1 Tax=Senna tora TaxID=362788 RepID=A0A834XG21_9FABA|nr:protein FAR1-RELATED SEQUENCE 5-like [Senna tora]
MSKHRRLNWLQILGYNKERHMSFLVETREAGGRGLSRFMHLASSAKWHQTPRQLDEGGSHFLQDFKSSAKVYTPPIFDEFQYEFNISLACSIKYKHESDAGFEYGITIVGREVEFRVLFNPPQKAVSCSLHFGEMDKNARSDVILDVKENEVEQDPKLIRIRQHRQLWPDLLYLTSEVNDSEEGFLLVAKGLKDLRKQAEELLEREKDVNNFRDDSIPPMSACTSQPMGASSSQPMGASSSQPKETKKRQGNKRTRCYKN